MSAGPRGWMRNQQTMSYGLGRFFRKLAAPRYDGLSREEYLIRYPPVRFRPRGNGYVKTWRHRRPNADYCAISSFALSPSHVPVKTRDIGMAYAVQNLA
jgi:hypothetical protein